MCGSYLCACASMVGGRTASAQRLAHRGLWVMRKWQWWLPGNQLLCGGREGSVPTVTSTKMKGRKEGRIKKWSLNFCKVKASQEMQSIRREQRQNKQAGCSEGETRRMMYKSVHSWSLYCLFQQRAIKHPLKIIGYQWFNFQQPRYTDKSVVLHSRQLQVQHFLTF